LSVNRCKQAQGFFDTLTCVEAAGVKVCTNTAGVNLLDLIKRTVVGRRLQEEEGNTEAIQEGCH